MVLYSSSKKVEEINLKCQGTVHTSNEALLTGVALFLFSLRKHDIYRSVFV